MSVTKSSALPSPWPSMARWRSNLASSNLRGRVIRGGATSLVGFGTTNALRLAGNLILTRLLVPEAFGLVALAGIVTTALTMLSDLGLRPLVIQSRRGEQTEFLNTIWTLQVLRGFALALICASSAWPASLIFGEPMLLPILLVECVNIVMSGFVSPNVLLASKQIRVGRLLGLQLVEQVIRLCAMIGLSFVLSPVWALVIGGTIGYSMRVALSHTALPGPRCRFQWDHESLKEVRTLGRWLVLSTAVTFVLLQADRVVIGLVEDAERLGIYSISFYFFQAGLMALASLGSAVVLPAFVELLRKNDVANLKKQTRRMHLSTCLVFLPCFCFLAFFGDELIALLYDARYQSAGEMLKLLAIGGFGATLTATYGQVLLAAGDARRHTLLQVGKSLLWVIGLSAGAYCDGLVGAIVGGSIARTLEYPFTVYLTRHFHVWQPAWDALIGSMAMLVVGVIWWCLP